MESINSTALIYKAASPITEKVSSPTVVDNKVELNTKLDVLKNETSQIPSRQGKFFDQVREDIKNNKPQASQIQDLIKKYPEQALEAKNVAENYPKATKKLYNEVTSTLTNFNFFMRTLELAEGSPDKARTLIAASLEPGSKLYQQYINNYNTDNFADKALNKYREIVEEKGLET